VSLRLVMIRETPKTALRQHFSHSSLRCHTLTTAALFLPPRREQAFALSYLHFVLVHNSLPFHRDYDPENDRTKEVQETMAHFMATIKNKIETLSPPAVQTPIPIPTPTPTSINTTLPESLHAFVTVIDVGAFQGGAATAEGLRSTNGCTVIAAVAAASHVNSSEQEVSSDTMIRINNIEASPLLDIIRWATQVSAGAFLEPAVTQEYLMSLEIIDNSKSVGIWGGNILDEDHVNQVLDHMGSTTAKKCSATLFFHGHVRSLPHILNSIILIKQQHQLHHFIYFN
jgi:hypothetical protein